MPVYRYGCPTANITPQHFLRCHPRLAFRYAFPIMWPTVLCGSWAIPYPAFWAVRRSNCGYAAPLLQQLLNIFAKHPAILTPTIPSDVIDKQIILENRRQPNANAPAASNKPGEHTPDLPVVTSSGIWQIKHWKRPMTSSAAQTTLASAANPILLLAAYRCEISRSSANVRGLHCRHARDKVRPSFSGSEDKRNFAIDSCSGAPAILPGVINAETSPIAPAGGITPTSIQQRNWHCFVPDTITPQRKRLCDDDRHTHRLGRVQTLRQREFPLGQAGVVQDAIAASVRAQRASEVDPRLALESLKLLFMAQNR